MERCPRARLSVPRLCRRLTRSPSISKLESRAQTDIVQTGIVRGRVRIGEMREIGLEAVDGRNGVARFDAEVIERASPKVLVAVGVVADEPAIMQDSPRYGRGTESGA